MGFLSNLYNTVKSAFTPAPAPTNILTPEAQARAAALPVSRGGTAPAPTAPTLTAANFGMAPPVGPTPTTSAFPLAPAGATPKSSSSPTVILTPEAQLRASQPGLLPSGAPNAAARIAATAPGVFLSPTAIGRSGVQPTLPIPGPSQPPSYRQIAENIPGLGGALRLEKPLGSALGFGMENISPYVYAGAVTPGLAAIGAITGLAQYGFGENSGAANLFKNISKTAFQNIGPLWSRTEKDNFNKQVEESVTESLEGETPEEGGPVDLNIITDTSGKNRVVAPDGVTKEDAETALRVGLKQTLLDAEQKATERTQIKLDKVQSDALDIVASQTGLDRAAVSELINSDPGVNFLYLEALKVAKGKTDESPIDDETKKTLKSTAPAGVDAVGLYKTFLDQAGYTQITEDITKLEGDFADVKNFYQTRHDEIEDNPEFPQWLKARRDEFITKKEERALTLYENKIKNLKDQRDRTEKLAMEYTNLSLKQYDLDLQAKRDALNQADTLADNDRQTLADYLEYFSKTGTNWDNLSFQQQENIRKQFIDPGAIDTLSAFDFKSVYDNELALDWASKRSANASLYKPTTTQYGDTVFQVTYDANGNPVYKALGRAGSPTTAQTRQDFIEWMGNNQGAFTEEQFKSVAESINPEYLNDGGITNLINQYAAKKEGGFLGFGGSYSGALSQEDAITSFNSFQSGKAFTGGPGAGGGDQSEQQYAATFQQLVALHGVNGVTREDIIDDLTGMFPMYTPESIAAEVYKAIPNK